MKVISVVHKKRLKRALPQLFGALAVLFVTIGALGAIYFQKQLSEASLDNRLFASEDEGAVFIRSPQNGQTSAFVPETERVLQLEIKTQAEKLQQIQLSIAITTDVFDPPIFKVPASGKLEITAQQLAQTATGYSVSITLDPKTSDPFSAPDWQPLVELYYTPIRGGSIVLTFDPATSKALAADTQLDTLKNIERITYIIVDSSSGSQQLPANVGGPVVDLCNIPCASNGECGLNQRCFDTGADRRCRLASNTASLNCTVATSPTETTVVPGKGGALTVPSTEPPSPVVSAPPAATSPTNASTTSAPEIEVPATPTTNALTPDDSVAQQRSAFDDFFAMIEDFDIRAFIPGLGDSLDFDQRYRAQQQLPYIALGIGILFVVIASGFFLKNSLGSRSRTEYSNSNTFETGDSSAQANSPQTTSHHAQSAVTRPPPALPLSPIPRTAKHHGLQPASAAPSLPAHHAHNSAMLNRLKAKGIHPPEI